MKMKILDNVIRRMDARSIKKTGHRMTQDEIDLVKAGYRAAKLEQIRDEPVQQTTSHWQRQHTYASNVRSSGN